LLACPPVTLIVTTYNWPAALDLTLRSVARQSVLPNEVIVADDGSGPPTREVVKRWQEQLTVPLVHVWQADEGFRLARSRNRAIAAARGDYVIIVDGDMVLHRHFVQRRRHTVRNLFLSKLTFGKRTGQHAIRGCNQAYWKSDLIRVNGFNEAFVGWGREDNEIAARLYNTGVQRRNLKFQALAIHLHHPVRHAELGERNDAILRSTLEQRKTWCPLGLSQHLEEAGLAAASSKHTQRWLTAREGTALRTELA
jgi:glycosyltransferase involved in cell wall biosynthesis